MGRASVFTGLVLVLACIGLAKSPQSYRNPSLPTEDGRDLFAKHYNTGGRCELFAPYGRVEYIALGTSTSAGKQMKSCESSSAVSNNSSSSPGSVTTATSSSWTGACGEFD